MSICNDLLSQWYGGDTSDINNTMMLSLCRRHALLLTLCLLGISLEVVDGQWQGGWNDDGSWGSTATVKESKSAQARYQYRGYVKKGGDAVKASSPSVKAPKMWGKKGYRKRRWMKGKGKWKGNWKGNGKGKGIFKKDNPTASPTVPLDTVPPTSSPTFECGSIERWFLVDAATLSRRLQELNDGDVLSLIALEDEYGVTGGFSYEIETLPEITGSATFQDNFQSSLPFAGSFTEGEWVIDAQTFCGPFGTGGAGEPATLRVTFTA